MAAEFPPLLEQLSQNPLLIAEDAQAVFQSTIQYLVAHEHAEDFLSAPLMGGDDDFWPTSSDDWRSSYRPYNVKNGILQIPVMGVLLNRFPWQAGRWATGYPYIEKAWQRGMADANVKGIAYIHDTPGGEVAGNFELAEKLFASRKDKPQRSFAADHSYSAGYSLASAPGPISISKSGGVGSIGVVTAHVEYADAMAKAGVKVTFIFAGKHKVDGNAYEKLSDAVKTRIQGRIDRIYDVFVKAVSRNRKMDESAVRGTEALTYDALDSLKVGLADRVGSLEEEMVLFSNDIISGDEQMADTTVQGVPQATHDAAVASARTEGEAAGVITGKAAGFKEGATAERDRVKAIFALDESKTRPAAAKQVALETDLPVDKAKAFLTGMPAEKASGTRADRNHFEEHMEQNAPDVGGGEGDEDEGSDAAATPAKETVSLMSSYKAAGGAVKRKTS